MDTMRQDMEEAGFVNVAERITAYQIGDGDKYKEGRGQRGRRRVTPTSTA